ncbi:hypothetical protein GCM10010995_26840 [Cysteiniphilum litorale]|uniref:Uncharacterized protein n=1 Tax=Cysteiniphilum litorale TaxID=2056700 RepID=A0A8J2Z756_9GAMM|nr:hypothetical protein GCM10010995_26840 [Cysteiniphilum litorale]
MCCHENISDNNTGTTKISIFLQFDKGMFMCRRNNQMHKSSPMNTKIKFKMFTPSTSNEVAESNGQKMRNGNNCEN